MVISAKDRAVCLFFLYCALQFSSLFSLRARCRLCYQHFFCYRGEPVIFPHYVICLWAFCFLRQEIQVCCCKMLCCIVFSFSLVILYSSNFYIFSVAVKSELTQSYCVKVNQHKTFITWSRKGTCFRGAALGNSLYRRCLHSGLTI